MISGAGAELTRTYAQLLAVLNDDPLSDVRWGPNYSSGTRVLVKTRGRWLPYLITDLTDTLSGLPTALSFLGSPSPIVVVSAQSNANLKVNTPISDLVFSFGPKSIGTTATNIVSPVNSNLSTLLIKNTGTQTVFLGDSTVTASGGTKGYPYATADVPLVISPTPGPVYGIVPSGTGEISIVYMA